MPQCAHNWSGAHACPQCVLQDKTEILRLSALLDETRVERDQLADMMSKVMRLHMSYSLQSTLDHLVKAVDHLLDDHGCDGHGYEITGSARDAAKEILKVFETWEPSAKAPWHPAMHPGLGGWCHDSSCVDPMHRVMADDEWKKQLVPGEMFTYEQAAADMRERVARANTSRIATEPSESGGVAEMNLLKQERDAAVARSEMAERKYYELGWEDGTANRRHLYLQPTLADMHAERDATNAPPPPATEEHFWIQWPPPLKANKTSAAAFAVYDHDPRLSPHDWLRVPPDFPVTEIVPASRLAAARAEMRDVRFALNLDVAAPWTAVMLRLQGILDERDTARAQVVASAARHLSREEPPKAKAPSANRHMAGCNTERRGCVPGCDCYNPKVDYRDGDETLIADAFARARPTPADMAAAAGPDVWVKLGKHVFVLERAGLDPLPGTIRYTPHARAEAAEMREARAIRRLLARRGQFTPGKATLDSEIDAVFENENRDEDRIEKLTAEVDVLRTARDEARRDPSREGVAKNAPSMLDVIRTLLDVQHSIYAVYKRAIQHSESPTYAHPAPSDLLRWYETIDNFTKNMPAHILEAARS